MTLGALATASGLLLCVRFLAGAPLPLGLLQIAFAVLAGSVSLLLVRGLAGLILRLQRN